MAKNNVTIILDEGCNYYECGIVYDKNNNPNGRYITIVTDKDDDYFECINDKDSFSSAREFSDIDCTYEEFFKDNYTLQIHGNVDDVIYFLNNNEIDKEKIVISSKDSILSIKDEDYINRLVDGVSDISNIYVKTKENTKEVKLENYKQTIEYIEFIAQKVKSMNLSPYESLIYLYDIVRDRNYESEKEDDDASDSRDLTSVINGKKIVCVGFSVIFDSVAKKLGYKSKEQFLVNKEMDDGHARNMVYVKDDKYNIDGILIFDPTAGCKRDDTNNHFNSYLYCGRPIKFFKYVDKCYERDLTDHDVDALKHIYEKAIMNNDKITPDDIIRIKNIYQELLGESLVEPSKVYKVEENNKIQEEVKEKVINFYKLFYSYPDNDTFSKAITNVRIIEYYEDSSKFSLSVDKIKEIFIQSWPISEEDYIENEEEDKKVNRVILTKILQKVLQEKNK